MASISGILTTTTTFAVPVSSACKTKPSPLSPMLVECSSRPKKKATAHHMKTRPKKSQPWDIRRKGPTAYPPLPDLPPDWTFVSSSPTSPPQAEEEEEESVEVAPVLAAAAAAPEPA